jgi:hypothetical protein
MHDRQGVGTPTAFHPVQDTSMHIRLLSQHPGQCIYVTVHTEELSLP